MDEASDFTPTPRQEAFRLAAMKLPVDTRFVTRLGE